MGVISFDRCVELYLILQVCGVDHDQAAGQLEQFPFLLNRFFFFFFYFSCLVVRGKKVPHEPVGRRYQSAVGSRRRGSRAGIHTTLPKTRQKQKVKKREN